VNSFVCQKFIDGNCHVKWGGEEHFLALCEPCVVRASPWNSMALSHRRNSLCTELQTILWSSWYPTRGRAFVTCQIFREVIGLERVPLSLVSTIEELLGRIRP
jgi:hypothetical protein